VYELQREENAACSTLVRQCV